MKKEDLKKLVEHEAQWLKYYTSEESKKGLHFDDIYFYDRLKSIGYTKRVVNLDRRCMAACMTSPKNVLTDDIETLIAVAEPRKHVDNFYSPLEVWVFKFPKEITWILNMILGV